MEKYNHFLFVDTWGWLTLFDKKEKYHNQVRKTIENLADKGYQLVTTDFVLDETNTILFRRLQFDLAQKAFKEMYKLVEKGYIKVIWIDKNIFNRTIKIRYKYKDKPEISFTDLTSFIVMELLDIQNVITQDKHFLIVGMGFQTLPKINNK